MTIATDFGHAIPSVPDKSSYPSNMRCVGIEIEQEYASYESFRDIQEDCGKEEGSYANWRIVDDGSMRNYGIEFVSKVLWPSEIDASLEDVWPVVSHGSMSWRAGIHVHVDVRDLTYTQLRNISILYSILEPIIFKWEGNNRQESRFCIPWYSCTNSVNAMFTHVSDDKTTNDIASAVTTFGKYAGLNLIPITNQGSVEFRHLQTVGDLDKVKKYIGLCVAIVEFGRNEIDYPKLLSSGGAYNFINKALGGYGNFLTEVPDYDSLIWEGIDTSNAIDLAKVPNDRRYYQSNSESIKLKDFEALVSHFMEKGN